MHFTKVVVRGSCLWNVVGGSGVEVWAHGSRLVSFSASWLAPLDKAQSCGSPQLPPFLPLLGCDSVVFVLMSASLSVPLGAVVTATRACHTWMFARGLKVQQEATLP